MIKLILSFQRGASNLFTPWNKIADFEAKRPYEISTVSQDKYSIGLDLSANIKQIFHFVQYEQGPLNRFFTAFKMIEKLKHSFNKFINRYIVQVFFDTHSR